MDDRISVEGILVELQCLFGHQCLIWRLTVGEAAFAEIPTTATLASLQPTRRTNRGLYLFPGLGLGQHETGTRKEVIATYGRQVWGSP